ncbi:MAG: hypothetical protein ACFE0I_02585 [Elainellaceae cyanobacterium]
MVLLEFLAAKYLLLASANLAIGLISTAINGVLDTLKAPFNFKASAEYPAKPAGCAIVPSDSEFAKIVKFVWENEVKPARIGSKEFSPRRYLARLVFVLAYGFCFNEAIVFAGKALDIIGSLAYGEDLVIPLPQFNLDPVVIDEPIVVSPKFIYLREKREPIPEANFKSLNQSQVKKAIGIVNRKEHGEAITPTLTPLRLPFGVVRDLKAGRGVHTSKAQSLGLTPKISSIPRHHHSSPSDFVSSEQEYQEQSTLKRQKSAQQTRPMPAY